ncbi:nucleotide-diphospho-sugar transferase [Pelagophyceae sp. CCMP2097]|nr:nucleotide-diphospho-sugar transferase [Pelagophyceae sp. CCMP2097]
MPGDAFVTLLTNDGFSPGAEALLFSLRKTTTKATLVVLVTPEVSARVRRVLGRAADSVVDVLPISNPHATHVAGWADAGFTKLRIWQQTQFDRIVYVDADAVVVDNIDELFALDVAFAAAPDVFPPDKFNAGVLVIKPCLETFARLEAAIPLLPSHDGGDTGFLNSFFPDWFASPASCRLAFGYNAQRTLHWFTHSSNPGYWDSISPLKVVHFSSSPKPWDAPGKKGPLELLWWDTFMQAQGAPALSGYL